MVCYRFNNVELDLSDGMSKELELSLSPAGCFYAEKGEFELLFDFFAKSNKDGVSKDVVHVACKASFKFVNIHDLDKIPDYFYANSIAIIFPYVRAFISTVTLQDNVPPIVIPTLNLSALRNSLISNTMVK